MISFVKFNVVISVMLLYMYVAAVWKLYLKSLQTNNIVAEWFKDWNSIFSVEVITYMYMCYWFSVYTSPACVQVWYYVVQLSVVFRATLYSLYRE